MRSIVLLTLSLLMWGCGSAITETGYEPRKLNMGESQLKGLYAPKYSPEAAQAQAERERDNKSKNPSGLFQ